VHVRVSDVTDAPARNACANCEGHAKMPSCAMHAFMPTGFGTQTPELQPPPVCARPLHPCPSSGATAREVDAAHDAGCGAVVFAGHLPEICCDVEMQAPNPTSKTAELSHCPPNCACHEPALHGVLGVQSHEHPDPGGAMTNGCPVG